MRKAVPDDQKRDFVHPPNAPVDVRIHTHLHYDRDQVCFKAIPNYNGSPWFDYGFISIDENHKCAEEDPIVDEEDEEEEPRGEEEEVEEKEPTYRALVRFWGFVTHQGNDYALVDLFEKEHKNRPISSDFLHKILRPYKWVEFGAVPVDCIIATAVVFPNLDHDPTAEGVYRRVLYHPSFTELCGGSRRYLPKADMWAGDVEDCYVDPDDWEEEKKDQDEESSAGEEEEEEEEDEEDEDEEDEDEDEDEDEEEDEEDRDDVETDEEELDTDEDYDDGDDDD
jgi:hypothetical protein